MLARSESHIQPSQYRGILCSMRRIIRPIGAIQSRTIGRELAKFSAEFLKSEAALRFYEDRGLITSERASSGHRRLKSRSTPTCATRFGRSVRLEQERISFVWLRSALDAL